LPVEETKQHVYDLMFWQAVLFSAIILCTVLFYRDSPPTLPSLAANKKIKREGVLK